MEENTLSSNLERIRNATDDIRTTLDMPSASIEELAEAVIVPPSGTIQINSNGLIDVSAYEYVNVSVGDLREKDVNFYDYDGTLTNSYTKADFLALESLPDNPTHSGLTSQGWNWSLSDAKTYVTNYGKLNIGQMYITDNGATRIYIHLEEGRTSPYCGFAVNGTATIAWGDGTTSTVTGTNNWTVINTQHNYSQPGDYVISISSSSTIQLYGSNQYGSYVLWNNIDNVSGYYSTSNNIYQNSIRKVELGNALFYSSAFCNCYLLSSITIPRGVTSIDERAFYQCVSLSSVTIPSTSDRIGNIAFAACYSLSSVIIPNSVNYMDNDAFEGCTALSSITLPSELTAIRPYMFYGCRSLSSVTIPSSITSTFNYIFEDCLSLSSITLPNSITSLGAGALRRCKALSQVTIPNNMSSIPNMLFSECSSLSSVTIPSSITSIGSDAFNCCYSVAYYDFSNHISIPTLSNINAFNEIPSDCKIIVPDSLYEDWIVANNWSTYASYIIKASEWEGGNE